MIARPMKNSVDKLDFMQGAPVRRLQTITTRAGFSKQVASTGNSPLAGVLLGLKTYKGYVSPAQAHWKQLQERYSVELAHLHWLNTGEVEPRRRRCATAATRKARTAGEISADLMALIKL